MKIRVVVGFAILTASVLIVVHAIGAGGNPAAEYASHFSALSKLSVAVAEAMPPTEYDFRPDPPSMSYGELMLHIAKTNFHFCAALNDSTMPPQPPPGPGKDNIVKFLNSSFDYCSTVIPSLTEQQLNAQHNSPDGRLLGREVLLALYVHVAHHRGQAEIYLRDKGIQPPPYRI